MTGVKGLKGPNASTLPNWFGVRPSPSSHRGACLSYEGGPRPAADSGFSTWSRAHPDRPSLRGRAIVRPLWLRYRITSRRSPVNRWLGSAGPQKPDQLWPKFERCALFPRGLLPGETMVLVLNDGFSSWRALGFHGSDGNEAYISSGLLGPGKPPRVRSPVLAGAPEQQKDRRLPGFQAPETR